MALTRFQDSEAILKDVELLIAELERLRLAYEQYFLGLERKPPDKLRDTVTGLVRRNSGVSVQNARLRFRLQQAIARYSTYTAYWDRVLREMEDGTYNRDVFKARLHEKERGVGTPETKKKEKAPPDPVDALFHQYVEARKKCNESLKGLTLESFRKTMQTQLDTIKAKTGTDKIAFQVVVEAGKSKIKAVAQAKKKPA